MAKKIKDVKPIPLFPKSENIAEISIRDYPELCDFLTSGPEWRYQTWSWGQEFLAFIGRNKSTNTYVRFRSEVEKFLLWSFIKRKQSIVTFKKSEILEYMEFCNKPDVDWICFTSFEKFIVKAGTLKVNPLWAPFKMSGPVQPSRDKKILKGYRPTVGTLNATFTAMISFYTHLNDEEYYYGNPAKVAKKDCRLLIQDDTIKDDRRLSDFQWDILLETSIKMADSNPIFERNLFLIVSLKTFFIRISEFAEKKDWIPEMGHFTEDSNGNWWVKVLGKGGKKRSITVPPDYLPYLRRYRISRGLSLLPLIGEKEPMIKKIRGRGGLATRHLSKIVTDTFNAVRVELEIQKKPEEAIKFQAFSAHWLRHTGASLEVERGRPLKDLSEDLGHSTMATTDRIYVHSDVLKRAKSGAGRKVGKQD